LHLFSKIFSRQNDAIGLSSVNQKSTRFLNSDAFHSDLYAVCKLQREYTGDCRVFSVTCIAEIAAYVCNQRKKTATIIMFSLILSCIQKSKIRSYATEALDISTDFFLGCHLSAWELKKVCDKWQTLDKHMWNMRWQR
jgi:hypothetical protein